MGQNGEKLEIITNTETGSKRIAVAKSVQTTLSKNTLLANFLLTGTLLIFEMILPVVYKNRKCTHVTTPMILALLGLCVLSCIFFQFTESFKGRDGMVYYGIVTLKGLYVFKPGPEMVVPTDDEDKLGVSDFVHAVMSAMIFGVIALADHRVTDCLFPGHAKDIKEVMEMIPLMVGVICSGLFLVFGNNNRYGIGCMAK